MESYDDPEVASAADAPEVGDSVPMLESLLLQVCSLVSVPTLRLLTRLLGTKVGLTRFPSSMLSLLIARITWSGLELLPVTNGRANMVILALASLNWRSSFSVAT
jgi:hypothetical protein